VIRFGRDVCGNLEAATAREWLETNGLGGFASSTVTGLNSRRYHGLLVAATQPPVGRFVLLSKLEETLVVDGTRFELSVNRYPGTFHPGGFRFLSEFRLDPCPVFRYEVEGVTLEKLVFMVQGENTTVVQYRILSKESSNPGPRILQLELRPLIAFRGFHNTTHENAALNPDIETAPGLTSFAPYAGLPSLHLAHNEAEVERCGCWYRNFEYERECQRGLDFTEDLFNPCVLRFDLTSRGDAVVIASTERRDSGQAAIYLQSELGRRQSIVASVPADEDLVKSLVLAADQFIVARADRKTVIAGYHWFSDWGRDTMIALPGLTLVTKRYDVARSILLNFAQHVDHGMLPNHFPDSGEVPEYNTVDATLWLFEAVRAYLAYTGDLDFVRSHIYRVLADIVSWHVRGTRFGIKVDSAGLLSSAEPGVQLTWMDAKVGDRVVTPRRGRAVEIQALWYNALSILENLAQKIGDESGRRRYLNMATVAKWSFNRLFWNERGGYLNDVVDNGTADASIRPNQIFAVSLPHMILTPERAIRVVEVVKEHLLTPYGLRTLAPTDPQYHGRYSGDQASRDAAYHQGTVWPWLLGPFIAAYVKVYGNNGDVRLQADAWLSQLRQHIADCGVGQIPEIFDGDPPHRPCGCVAQAWSVAEILRSVVEDIRSIRTARHSVQSPTMGTHGDLAPSLTRQRR